MRRKLAIGAVALGVAVAAGVAILVVSRWPGVLVPPLDLPERDRFTGDPTPAEDQLLRRAEREGWPTDHPDTKFATLHDRPYIMVYTEKGMATLVLTKNNLSFQVDSYATLDGRTVLRGDALPGAIRKAGLPFSQFLELMKEHGLDQPAD